MFSVQEINFIFILQLMSKKRSSVGNVFQSIQSRKKEGGEKQSSSVPYMLMRDA